MSKRDNIRRWVRRHKNKHLCSCGCGLYIEVSANHYKRGIPKYIKGHNFFGEHNPRTEGEPTVRVVSPLWEILSDEEKERRLANLRHFGQMEEHYNWKGGRITNEAGYVMVRSPEHPMNNEGYVLEHRLVLEDFLRKEYPGSPFLMNISGGIYLKPDVVVHHINGKKDDNRLDNIFPLTPALHSFWHQSKLPVEEKIKYIKEKLLELEKTG